VMFLHSPGDKLEALDAATGDLLWQYARLLPPSVNAGNKRAIAIYGNKVYMGTSDVHVVALDVKTVPVISVGACNNSLGVPQLLATLQDIDSAISVKSVGQRSIHNMIAQRVLDQFGGVCHFHLFQDSGAICTHRRHAQVQFLGNLAGCFT
jgi:glucose dehydrogenase